MFKKLKRILAPEPREPNLEEVRRHKNRRLCSRCQAWDDLMHVVFCRAEFVHSEQTAEQARWERFPGIGKALGEHHQAQINLLPKDVKFLPLSYFSSHTGCMICAQISSAIESHRRRIDGAQYALLRPFPTVHPRKRLPSTLLSTATRSPTLHLGMTEQCVLPICVQAPSSSNGSLSYQRLDIELSLEYEHRAYDLKSVSRWDRSLIELNQIKLWLNICRQQHGDACNKLLSPMSLPQYFRVIDTRLWCITKPQPSVEYITLSYVWSQAQASQSTLTEPFKLLAGNISALSRKDSLRTRELPEVIADAIQMCADLGQRYLWVDRLCIVQDKDHPEQLAQIKAMDAIYHLATFTLVHISDGTGMGLPGVSSRPRETSLVNRQWELRGKDDFALALGPNIEDAVNDSIWNTRGWTYQERLLSRRHVFLSKNEVWFNCCSKHHTCGQPFREDFHLERAFETGLGDKLSVVSYKEMVMAYSRRTLTVQSDILNAFTGVSNVLARQLDTAMIKGLPEKYLLRTLVWGPAPAVRLSDTTVPVPTTLSLFTTPPPPPMLPFPTWSWAASGENVCYNGIGEDPMYPLAKFERGEDHFVGNLVWFYYCDPEKGLRPVNEERVWFSEEQKLSKLNAEYRSVTYKSNLESWGRKLERTGREWLAGAPRYGGDDLWPDPPAVHTDSWTLEYSMEEWRRLSVEMWRNFVQSPWESERRVEIAADVRARAESIPGCLVFNTTCATVRLGQLFGEGRPVSVSFHLVDSQGSKVGHTMYVELPKAATYLSPDTDYHAVVLGAVLGDFLDAKSQQLMKQAKQVGRHWDPLSPWGLHVLLVRKEGGISKRLALGVIWLPAWARLRPRWETVILV
ncbi:Fc.00g023980.m01.CDS01 [Cosmosporella sp. VM-42]